MEYKPGMWVKDKTAKEGEISIGRLYSYNDYYDVWSLEYCNYLWPRKEKELEPMNIKIRLSDDMEERKRQSEAIQLKAFGHGLKWPGQISNYVDETESACIFLEYENGKILRDLTDEYFQGYDDIELTPAEFLGDEDKPLKSPKKMDKIEQQMIDRAFKKSVKIIEPHMAGITPEPRHYPQTTKYKCPQCKETGDKPKIQKHHRDYHGEHISSTDPRWNDWKVN